MFAALLVHVVHDLRVPRRVERVHRVARLGLGEGVPVPVVVVAGVVVVELRRRAALGGGVERGAVPVADDVHAVGVLRRHEHDDRVREHQPRLGGLGAREPVGEHNRGRSIRRPRSSGCSTVTRMTFLPCSMSASRSSDGVRSRGSISFRWIVRYRSRFASVAESAMNATRKGRPEHGLAERAHLHARARLVERGEVVGDLRPGRQLAVGAGGEAEHLLEVRERDGGGTRCRSLRSELRGGGAEGEQDRGEAGAGGAVDESHGESCAQGDSARRLGAESRAVCEYAGQRRRRQSAAAEVLDQAPGSASIQRRRAARSVVARSCSKRPSAARASPSASAVAPVAAWSSARERSASAS